MIIIVNAEQREVQDGLTVAAFLDELGIQRERVAVELNLDIVPKSRLAEIILKDGDRLEIVNFVGGGQDVE